MDLKKTWAFLQEIFSEWSEDKASRLAAALSYYTVFSLPSLLLIVIAVAGFALGQQRVQQQILNQVSSMAGSSAADAIKLMLQGASLSHKGSIIAVVVGVVTLLMGATGAFVQLQQALNTIWEVAPAPDRGLVATVVGRLLSFALILGLALFLLVFVIASALIAAAGKSLQNLVPQGLVLAQILTFVFTFVIITLFFAVVYKVLPDATVAWKDVWVGALVTAGLFTLGRYLLNLYLGRGSTGSAYGAAGSLVVIMLWVYYTAQILFFGAEFTQVYARHAGSRIVPAKGAVWIYEKEIKEQEDLDLDDVQIDAETEAPQEAAGVAAEPAAPAPPAAKKGRAGPIAKGMAPAIGALVAGLILGAFYRRGATTEK